MIIINKLCKNKIQNLSLYIRSGELVFVYDRKIANIQKLFHLFTGRIEAESGTIRYLENGSYQNLTGENKIGYVYSKNILLPGRTIKENMQYIMFIKNLNLAYSESRIRRILKFVGLDNYQDARPDELLDHQLLRANIAAAIINYPPVLILHQPTSVLDQVNAQGILHLLYRLNTLSMTIMILSSDPRPVLGNDIRFIKLNQCSGKEKKDYYA